ncbi:MAG: hypothetical protein DCC67_03300 [Planctomycetota bacterium]|nr:MAG: hypothetical protein DCC67_03300 [Planctomycetota bacterium]
MEAVAQPPVPPHSADFAVAARKHYRLLKIGVLALMALACAIPFSLNLVDPDLWGHVRYGQDWLAAGQMPRTATHTYTAVGYPWVNHENAAELLLAIAYEHIGVYGMLVAKCALGMCIVAAMAWLAIRKGVPALAAWTWLLLVSANLQAFFPMRPQLLSFALCTMALVCLDRAFPTWPEGRQLKLRRLWPLPLVFVAWVNSHGGFVAGLCIVGTLLLGRMAEIFLRDGWKAWRPLIHLATIGLLCLAATLVNPYGLGMHQWLWHSWGGAPPEITEWAPPLPGKPVFWPFVTLVGVSAACLVATRRQRDWTHIVVLALVAWQASLHLRHIAFVALLCGFWVPVHWHSALRRLRPDRDEPLPIMLPSPWMRRLMAAAILAGIVLQSDVLARRLSDLPVLRSQYPVDALQFMVDHGLEGRLAVAFNWAQYAIAALAPDVTVGFDGRFDTCYPQEAIDVHFDFLLGDSGPRERRPGAGPIDGRRILEYGRPDLLLVQRCYRDATRIMQQESAREASDWTLLYSDSVAELWGRRNKYDEPSSPDYFPPEQRVRDRRLLEARFQWPALPDRSLADERERAANSGQLSGL